MRQTVREFKGFLREYKIVALAIAFVMGAASTSLVKSIVNDIIMPVLTPLIPGDNWKESVLAVGSARIGWGSFLSELINFTALALVVFIVAKKILREDKAGKVQK